MAAYNEKHIVSLTLALFVIGIVSVDTRQSLCNLSKEHFHLDIEHISLNYTHYSSYVMRRLFTLCPAFALVSTNMTPKSLALFSPSSVVTSLHEQ